MTQAPTPGPLSGDDIGYVRDYWSAICDSDWHLIPADIRDDLEERLVAVGLAEWRAVTDDDLEDTFAYERGIEKGRSCLDLTALGHLAFKSDADGWMPWSGGENPVPGKRVDAEGSRFAAPLRDTPSDQVRWDRVARFRLAPTAPVEASGSEREADAWKWLGQLYPNDAPSDLAYDANEMVDAFLAGSGRSDRMGKALERIADEQQYRSGYCQTDITVEPALTAEEAQTVAREALAQQTALRPQPSGETRADALRAAGWSVAVHNDYRLNGEAHTFWLWTHPDGRWIKGEGRTDEDALSQCAALIRPAPVASGGQHSSGEVETLRVLLDNLVIAQALSKDIRQKATDEARSYLYDLRHAPTPAEAPVAETAGEAVAWQWRHGDDMEWHTSGVRHAWFDDEALNPRFRLRPLYAAPVPAQDDDKLRRAVEALERYAEQGYVGAQAALDKIGAPK